LSGFLGLGGDTASTQKAHNKGIFQQQKAVFTLRINLF